MDQLTSSPALPQVRDGYAHVESRLPHLGDFLMVVGCWLMAVGWCRWPWTRGRTESNGMGRRYARLAMPLQLMDFDV